MVLKFFDDRKAVRAFERQDPEFRQLVFYSEGAADWPHIGPIVERLANEHARTVSYVSSDPADPGLAIGSEFVRTFLVGAGTMRTVLFARLSCQNLITSLPDLDSLWLKRSVNPVHYVYLFHSTNSTHTSYREDAFDAYDAVLCVGPHHFAEIRRAEDVRNLHAKTLIEHGSVKLDAVMASVDSRPGAPTDGPTVLVAPTWGPSSSIEGTTGISVVESLVGAGITTILRLHPMTVRRLPQLVNDIERRFRHEPLFTLESDMTAEQSWLTAHAMVTDWSGAGVEYAFSLARPVIFLDTPQKIRNPNWRTLALPAFEAAIRSEVGVVLDESAVTSIPEVMRGLLNGGPDRRPHIDAVRERSIFNVGLSAIVGAEYLAAL
jgi:hypothetical protein